MERCHEFVGWIWMPIDFWEKEYFPWKTKLQFVWKSPLKRVFLWSASSFFRAMTFTACSLQGLWLCEANQRGSGWIQLQYRTYALGDHSNYFCVLCSIFSTQASVLGKEQPGLWLQWPTIKGHLLYEIMAKSRTNKAKSKSAKRSSVISHKSIWFIIVCLQFPWTNKLNKTVVTRVDNTGCLKSLANTTTANI